MLAMKACATFAFCTAARLERFAMGENNPILDLDAIERANKAMQTLGTRLPVMDPLLDVAFKKALESFHKSAAKTASINGALEVLARSVNSDMAKVRDALSNDKLGLDSITNTLA